MVFLLLSLLSIHEIPKPTCLLSYVVPLFLLSSCCCCCCSLYLILLYIHTYIERGRVRENKTTRASSSYEDEQVNNRRFTKPSMPFVFFMNHLQQQQQQQQQQTIGFFWNKCFYPCSAPPAPAMHHRIITLKFMLLKCNLSLVTQRRRTRRRLLTTDTHLADIRHPSVTVAIFARRNTTLRPYSPAVAAATPSKPIDVHRSLN